MLPVLKALGQGDPSLAGLIGDPQRAAGESIRGLPIYRHRADMHRWPYQHVKPGALERKQYLVTLFCSHYHPALLAPRTDVLGGPCVSSIPSDVG